MFWSEGHPSNPLGRPHSARIQAQLGLPLVRCRLCSDGAKTLESISWRIVLMTPRTILTILRALSYPPKIGWPILGNRNAIWRKFYDQFYDQFSRRTFKMASPTQEAFPTKSGLCWRPIIIWHHPSSDWNHICTSNTYITWNPVFWIIFKHPGDILQISSDPHCRTMSTSSSKHVRGG
jgi:hypothetical protein